MRSLQPQQHASSMLTETNMITIYHSHACQTPGRGFVLGSDGLCFASRPVSRCDPSIKCFYLFHLNSHSMHLRWQCKRLSSRVADLPGSRIHRVRRCRRSKRRKFLPLPLILEFLNFVLHINVYNNDQQSVNYLGKKDTRIRGRTRYHILDLQRRPIERIVRITEQMRSNGRSIDGGLGCGKNDWIFHQGSKQGI